MLIYNMVKYYKRKVVRRGRRKMYKRKYKTKTTQKTGFLSIRQKEFLSYTIPAGPLPNGFVRQLSFNIQSLPNFAALNRLFDQYRIFAVAGSLTPHTNTDDTINPGQSYIQSIDLDGGPVANYDTILQCANAKQSPWCTAGGMVPMKKFFLRPRFLNTIVVDPGDPAAVPPVPPTYSQTLGNRKAWIDLADNGLTEHYGMNFGWRTASPVGLNVEQTVNVALTFYLQFRKVR
ncbi:MAG: capsid protein [Cressdnaviricota sp.]|nr:MAG: capsid protein [Cressdnaviricota sp.]